MARMINADALQELCNKRIKDTWNNKTAPVSWAEAYADFKDDINSIPAFAQPGNPLTLEQLREMDGQPVWDEDVERWALVSVSDAGKWKDIPFALFEKNSTRFEWNIEGRELSLYSYPPAHIDRSKWTAEWVPMTDDDGCVWLECSACEYDLDSLEEPHPFCPSCGRAMMPEAWAELERSVRG